MKQTQLKTLRKKSITQLNEQLSQLEQDLTKRSLELAAGKLDDIKLPSRLRKDIAQIKTVIREKELIAQAKAKLAQEKKERD